MDNHDLMNILIEQIDIKDEELLEQLAPVTLKQVDVYVKDKQWNFHLNAPQRIKPELYQILQTRITQEFRDIAKVEIEWEFDEDEIDDQVIQEYWFAIYSALGYEKPYIKSCMKHARYEYEDNKLTIYLISQQEVDQVVDKYHALFVKRLKQVGISDLVFEYKVDDELYKQVRNQHYHRQEDEDEQSIKEAILAEKQKNERATANQTNGSVNQIGKDIPNGSPITPMDQLTEPQRHVVTEGYIFKKDVRDMRNGGQIAIYYVTDYTSSITVKIMTGHGVTSEQLGLYNSGDWVRLLGDVLEDNYSADLFLRPKTVRLIKPRYVREDRGYQGKKRIELHAHTQMSQLDATNSASDIIQQAAKWGHPAVAITDHAVVQAFPEAYNTAKNLDIKPIFGMEAYVVNDGNPVAYNSQDIVLSDATYVVFDVETTGLSTVYDKMIELAAVKMHKGEVIDRFESFINPNQSISAFITNLTSITNDMVKDAPQEAEVVRDFADFARGSIYVAHNASFDMGFIRKAYEKIGEPNDTIPVIDTLELSRLVNPHLKSHGLGPLTKRYNITLDQHHRAVYDAEATGYLMEKLLKQAEDQYQMVNHNQLNDRIGYGEAYKQAKPYHTTILVKNQAGLKDLFKLVSDSHIKYHYRTPRVPESVLAKYRHNFLLGTACSEGEVFTAMMQKGYDEAKNLVEKYDYIEIMPPTYYKPLVADGTLASEDALYDILNKLIKLGDDTGKLVVATGDVHYLDPKDSIYREALKRSINANQSREVVLPEAHFRTTDEMMEEFSFVGEELAERLVIDNPQKLVDLIDDIEVIKKDLYTPTIPGAEEEIKALTYRRAHELYGPDLPEIISERLEKELHSIIHHGFAVIYLIAQKLVAKSNEDGYLVGSRGSVGSSLVATMTGITEVNPLPPHYYCTECYYNEFFTDGSYGSGFDLEDKACPNCGAPLKKNGHDIPFETFLGFDGDKVPDIDLNFSGEYQSRAHAYTKELFGEDHVFRAGTITTVAAKTALGYARGYSESTGKDLPQAERERLAYGIDGVKRSTGQHPGGIIVIPSDMEVYDFTPIQYPADDLQAEWRTTHFDFHSIDANVLKLDILGHDDPTMIRMLQDLSGIDPNEIPFDDPDVMKLFSGTEVLGVTPEQIRSKTGTLGVPEFGTSFVRSMLEETHPSTFAELLQISGLSHGTDVWLGNAQELIRKNIVPLSDVIGCRDDIMVSLMQYGLDASLAFSIMEHVRKGRGIPDEWQEEMRAHGVPEWYIDSCLKIKYMFPKAHAAAYVMMALRVAYFKVHYPLYYYAAYFSVRAKDFDLVAMSQGKEVVKQRLDEIQAKGFDATNTEKTLQVELEVANEMLERGYRMQMVNLDKSDAVNFIIEGDSLIPPFRAVPGLGRSVAEQIVKARSEASFLSKEDLQKRGKVSSTLIAYLTEHGVLDHLPDEDQLTLF